jgi:plastocyanin
MVGAVLALSVFGCGGGGGTPSQGAATPTQGAATPTSASQAVICDSSGSGTAVAIADNTFSPSSATVAANGFVTWTNTDGTAHTVTFDSGPNCGNLSGGETQTVQFTVAGTYPYHCAIHSSMHGSVVVS